MRKWHVTVAGAAAAVGVACSDPTGSQLGDAAFDLSAAFTTIPQGYSNVANSYAGGAPGGGAPWLAEARGAGLGASALMGGGLADAYVGGIGFGRGFGHHGPFGGGLSCTGTFSGETGRVTCTTRAPEGLTVTRSAAYTDASGTVQQAFDSLTTNTVNIRSEVSGTVTYDRASDSTLGPGFGFGQRGGGRHGGGHHGPGGGLLLGDTATVLTATTTVHSSSDRTVTGLAQGSTQRTVDGASAGEESTTGTSSRGQFTASRIAADTTRGLVIPVETAGSATYPTAGTVIRVMQASVAYSGQEAATSSRREVVTYDGSATAKVVVTQDGVTQNCTRALPRGQLVCE